MTVFYILLAILLFGVLILVHEFGHFITAKLSGQPGQQCSEKTLEHGSRKLFRYTLTIYHHRISKLLMDLFVLFIVDISLSILQCFL